MVEDLRSKLRRAAPWIAIPAVALVAFLFGTCLEGEDSADAGQGHETHGDADQGTIWTCSMHPQIRQPEPGQCPICGMDLIPVTQGAGSDENRPERIELSEHAKAMAKVRTAPVRRLVDSAVERRLLGRIDYDETTLRTVTAWTGGRIDRLHVRVTGQRIRRGQVIATLYSPEVYSAQQDLIQTARQVQRLAQGSDTARRAAESALEATRQRLRLLGVPDSALATMERATAPTRNVPITSPYGGTVVERIATEGSYVQTGSGLYRVADLARLWVQLDAYESDLAILSVGQSVSLEVNAFPGETFDGRLAFIDPVLDPQRRTARVRVEVGNADGRLLPGMFAEAVIQSPVGSSGESPLVVPDTAPLFTGRRSVVYVEVPGTDRPTYDARVVRLGPRMGEHYPVVAGLSEGERVVINGAFAIDADLQIRGGSSMMGLPDDSQPGAYDEIVQAPPAFRAGLAPIITAYLEIQERLAADDLPDAKTAATVLGRAVGAFHPTEPREAVAAWEPLSTHLAGHAGHLARAASIEDARGAFEQLSDKLIAALRVFGNPLDDTLRVAFCPMAAGSQGAEWIQRGEAVSNSYFGASMLSCGEIRGTVEGHGYLGAAPAELPAAAPAQAGGHQH